MTFNPDILKNFRKDFAEAVKDLENKYNCKIDLGNIRYAANHFDSKLIVNSKTDIPEGMPEGSEIYYTTYVNSGARIADKYIGKTIIYNNVELMFVGYKPNARKRYIVLYDVKSKEYRLTTLDGFCKIFNIEF